MATQTDQLLSVTEVAKRLGVSRWTIWRLIKKGEFLEPFRISDQILRWHPADVDAWIESRRNT